MSEIPSSIPLECLFCGVALKVPENSNYSSGDLIKCQECGEDNDYDSLIEVVKDKAIQHAKNFMNSEIKKAFKKNRL